MPAVLRNRAATRIDDVAELLTRLVRWSKTPIKPMNSSMRSRSCLWAVSSLDPERNTF